ncbi:MAG: NDP-sugar synthase [Elusimicrobiota bacterium]
MKALILIGGLGTRLRPLTCYKPKPLLPIANKPFLEYQFQLIRKHGIREVVLCVAYLSHEFENYFGSGKRWGLKIRYVHEKEPMGTGGAIRNAAEFIDEPTVIFNGDILTDLDLGGMLRYHKQKKAFITIALSRVKDPTHFGLVETDKSGRIESFIEKPSWDDVTCNTINAGIYIFEPKAVNFIPPGINFSVERGLFPNLLSQKYPLYGYVSKGYWLDIGTIDKYLQANFDLLSNNIDLRLEGKKHGRGMIVGRNFRSSSHVEVEGRVICGNNVRISDFVQLHGNVCIGNNVSIGTGSYISDSVILDGTVIHEGARLEGALIGEKCVIEANSQLNPQTTLGNGTVIKKFSKL